MGLLFRCSTTPFSPGWNTLEQAEQLEQMEQMEQMEQLGCKLSAMPALHITPGDSAGGSLIKAIRDAGAKDEVLPFRDDLSCGPIDPDDTAVRAQWWGRFYDMAAVTKTFDDFWSRVANTDDRLVVWFGRHGAGEFSFFLHLVERLGDRPYGIVDVTDLSRSAAGPDGSTRLERPGCVGLIPHDRLRLLLGSERRASDEEKSTARDQWRRLRRENAPFRIVTAQGLASAPIDHFDSLLLSVATTEWRRVARVIGDAMSQSSEPYRQVSDMMLLARVIALIEQGKLLADGNPREMQSCRLRLPG